MKLEIKNELMVVILIIIGGIAEYYEVRWASDYQKVYAPVVITTLLYALFEIIKVLKSNNWTLKELAYNKLLIIEIWAIYFIGTAAYLLKLYTGVGL